MNIKDFKNLLRKYTKGKLNEIDSHLIDSWYDSFGYSENIKPLQDEAKAGKIHEKLSKELRQHASASLKARKNHNLSYAIAASILLAAGLFLFHFRLNWQKSLSAQNTLTPFDTVKTKRGKIAKVDLPDGSEVWLNAGSILRFSTSTFSNTRTVFLDQGEAFFKVVKDPSRPFEVHTSSFSTRVLGTSFNVKSYRELDYAAVLVKTGRVKVYNASSGSLITANQGLVYNRLTKTLTRNDRPATEAGSWVNGITVLHDVSFKELSLFFYNHYQFKLSSSAIKVLNYHYTITIRSDRSVDSVLKLICVIHNNHYYRRNKNEIVIY